MATDATGSARVGTAFQGLTQDMFLNLFIKQLQVQDPMNPLDSNQFTTQLAQMGQLEQVTTLNRNFASFLRVQEFSSARGLIGSQVTYVPANGQGSATGVVTAVRLVDNQVKLVVGTDLVAPSSVTQVTTAGT